MSRFAAVPEPEGALEFSFAGETVRWHVDGLALDRARRKGFDAGELLAGLEALDGLDTDDLATSASESEDEAAEGSVDPARALARLGDVAGLYGRLVWLGLLRFEADADLDAVLAHVDVMRPPPVAEMLAALFPPQREADAAGKGEAGPPAT
jgi:hypothetical protein